MTEQWKIEQSEISNYLNRYYAYGHEIKNAAYDLNYTNIEETEAEIIALHNGQEIILATK